MAKIKDVHVTSHKQEALQALNEKIERALEIIGGAAEGHAKKGAPYVTGNLRNSITYDVRTTDKGGTVYVGTNVVYARKQEYDNKRKAHYLKNSIANHAKQYKSIVEGELKS